MYDQLLQDHTLEDVVDELNCLMDYLRDAHEQLEELKEAYEQDTVCNS